MCVCVRSCLGGGLRESGRESCQWVNRGGHNGTGTRAGVLYAALMAGWDACDCGMVVYVKVQVLVVVSRSQMVQGAAEVEQSGFECKDLRGLLLVVVIMRVLDKVANRFVRQEAHSD